MDPDNLSFADMQKMQHELALKHGWNYDTVEGPLQLLWTYDEMGEVTAIVKKKSADKILNDPAVRGHFTEEICDVLMYLTDVLLCYGVSPQEISRAFTQKWEHNMDRTWDENKDLYEK
jgi:NTP pyrophosphatase (non-canonical NTP hydrolase)